MSTETSIGDSSKYAEASTNVVLPTYAEFLPWYMQFFLTFSMQLYQCNKCQHCASRSMQQVLAVCLSIAEKNNKDSNAVVIIKLVTRRGYHDGNSTCMATEATLPTCSGNGNCSSCCCCAICTTAWGLSWWQELKIKMLTQQSNWSWGATVMETAPEWQQSRWQQCRGAVAMALQ